jgi:hypothetical protein
MASVLLTSAPCILADLAACQAFRTSVPRDIP